MCTSLLLCDPQERFIISTLTKDSGKVLQAVDTTNGETSFGEISKANNISLHQGYSGYFSVCHHFNHYVEINIHNYCSPQKIIAKGHSSKDEHNFDLNSGLWSYVPNYYISYFEPDNCFEPILISVNPSLGPNSQFLDWYDMSYDKTYQPVLAVNDVPGCDFVMIGVLRSSTVILFHPRKRTKIGELNVSRELGAPFLRWRKERNELWLKDYSELVIVNIDNWENTESHQVACLFGGQYTSRLGEFSFDKNETICAVPRTDRNDIVGIDVETRSIKYRAEFENKVYAVSLFSDKRIFALVDDNKILSSKLEPFDFEKHEAEYIHQTVEDLIRKNLLPL